MKLLSLVVSAYNEEAGLETFYQTTREYGEALAAKGWDYEFVFVNDGSRDRTGEILDDLATRDAAHVRVLHFSRNFGHEAAMTAGLDYATGEGLVWMVADLQHPPKYLADIVDQFDAGYQVISMVRTENKTAGLLKNITSGGFYWLINRMSEVHLEANASDFFAITRPVQKVLMHNYREKVRFLRGYVQNVGFRKTTISYEAAPRVAGSSHYSIRKLFVFAMNTIMCFSNMPLKLGIFAGLFAGHGPWRCCSVPSAWGWPCGSFSCRCAPMASMPTAHRASSCGTPWSPQTGGAFTAPTAFCWPPTAAAGPCGPRPGRCRKRKSPLPPTALRRS